MLGSRNKLYTKKLGLSKGHKTVDSWHVNANMTESALQTVERDITIRIWKLRAFYHAILWLGV